MQEVETEIDDLSQGGRLQEPPLKKLKSKEGAIGQPGEPDSVLMPPPSTGDPNISTGFSFLKEKPPNSKQFCGIAVSDSDSSSSKKSLSVSGTSRQSQSESSSSSNKSQSGSGSAKSLSLSAMNTELVGYYLGLDIKKLLLREKHRASDLISVSQDNLDELFKKVYDSLSLLVEFGKFPHDLVNETPKANFVEMILLLVLKYVRTKFDLSEKQLFLQDEKTFHLKLNGAKKRVRADFVVRGEKCYLAVIECKKANCGWGIKQCPVYMLCLYHLNDDGKPIYGICSNGTHFNLLKYEPNEKPDLIDHFMLLESSRFVFAEMHKPEFEQDWKDNYTDFIRIVYSIVVEKLEV